MLLVTGNGDKIPNGSNLYSGEKKTEVYENGKPEGKPEKKNHTIIQAGSSLKGMFFGRPSDPALLSSTPSSKC